MDLDRTQSVLGEFACLRSTRELARLEPMAALLQDFAEIRARQSPGPPAPPGVGIERMRAVLDDFAGLQSSGRASRLEPMAVLLRDFAELRANQACEREPEPEAGPEGGPEVADDPARQRETAKVVSLEAIALFVRGFAKLRAQQDARRGGTFNLFKILEGGSRETRYSSMLAWLVDPRLGHGQAALFVNALADACGLGLPEELLEDCRVRTEFPGHEAVIDLMIYRRGELLIYIENKLEAAEGPDQLNREFRDMCRQGRVLGVPESRQFAVFLTPDGRRPTSGDPAVWRTLSYPRLANSLRSVLPQVHNQKVVAVLQDWLDTLASWEV